MSNRYYKMTNNTYITAIGTGPGGTEITEAEYNEILAIIRNRPQAEGKGYRLKTDLTWEEYDLPPEEIVEEEPTAEEKYEALVTALSEVYEE